MAMKEIIIVGILLCGLALSGCQRTYSDKIYTAKEMREKTDEYQRVILNLSRRLAETRTPLQQPETDVAPMPRAED